MSMSSDPCGEYDKYWNPTTHKCEQCESQYPIQQGYEFNRNCGSDGNGGLLEKPYRKCIDGTFNNGTFLKCQMCSSCSSLRLTASPCSATSDTRCCKQREQILNGSCTTPSPPVQSTELTTGSRTSVTAVSITDPTLPSTTPNQNIPNIIVTVIPVCVGILFTLTLVFLILFIWRRKRRRRTKHFNEAELKNCHNRAMWKSLPNQSISQSISYNIVRESSHNGDVTKSSYNLLAPEVQAAPLKTVLNNLDVLQELVLVLDPDISGAKNTRHLASQCSFTFAWINYAYSMKDHKSPLVAVLEGVVTKNPDWTVGHLAELLTGIGRNDAVEILAKLPAVVED